MQGIADERGRVAAGSLLGWWHDAGVDAAVRESPRDWLGHSKQTPPAAPTVAASTERPADLAAFQAWLATASGVPMDRPGAIRIAPYGRENAKVMLLSDLPDREDAAEGKPIGGQARTLAERMLAAIGIVPEESYTASLSCFHTPGARFNGDLEACASIAREHIRLAKPERLILFGDAPSRALLGEPLAKGRGRVHRIEGVRTIVTFHPRWLLQRPSDKALAWRDLLLLMSEND